MNKPILYTGIALGVAALGYMAYRFMQTPSQTYSTTSYNPASNPNTNNGVYKTYPLVANIDPRMDNSNQPWFNNNRGIIASGPQYDVNVTNVKMMSDVLKSGSEIIKSGQDIWQNVSAWYDDGNADAWLKDWEQA